MHELSDNQLNGLIIEETGQAHDASQTKLILSCIKHLKQFADFESNRSIETLPPAETSENKPRASSRPNISERREGIGLNLGYTVNINLPASTDPAVFDAIFRSIKEHLLSEDDA